MELDEFPEEVLNIKWGTPQEHINEFITEDYIHQNSAAYRILNDTFTREWSSDSDDDVRRKKEKPDPVPKPKLKCRLLRLYKPFTAYPRPSNLTTNQHQVYLKLMKKFANNFSPYMSKQEQEEFQLYQTLQVKVAAEQIQYLEFLKNFALSNQSRYSSISPDIKRYVNERWKAQLKNPLKYPRYYRPYRTIGLVLNDTKEIFDLIPQDEILNKGRVNIINIDKRNQRIERVYSKILMRHPIITEEIANKETLTTFNCPVSRDKNAEFIAEKMDVDFVLSSSGLKKICDNYPPFNKSWEIPVIVKEFDVKENGHSRKKRIIFIDKALPRRKMSVVDKLIFYYKIAVKSYLVNYKRSNFLQRESTKDDSQGCEDEEDSQRDFDAENDSESDGVDGPIGIKSAVEQPRSIVENAQSNEESEVLKQGSDDICVPIENNDLNEQNGNNAEASSVSMSDSDDEQLVIDVPEIAGEIEGNPESQNIKEPFLKNSRENAGKSKKIESGNEPLEESPKPKTRRMAKMLEALHKVKEITNIKSNDLRATLSVSTNAKPDPIENSEKTGEDKNSPHKDINESSRDNRASCSVKAKSKTMSLLDDLLEQQKKWFEQERPKAPNQGTSPLVDIRGKKIFLSGYKAIPPAKGCNYVYRLFNFKKKDFSRDLSSPGYRLLIRCKIDARDLPPKRRNATIVSKLEFQPEFGAEIVTASEMTQDWLSLRIRPFSYLIRARINAFTSDVMMVEKRECKDFYREEKYHNMQVSSCLNTLEAVLRAFHDLPQGEYIFSHEPKMGAFANIYMATNDTRGGVYDLHEQYNVDTSVDEPQVLSSLWVPIDFSLITPLQEELGRIPGTFIPRRKVSKNKSKKSNSRSQEAATSAT